MVTGINSTAIKKQFKSTAYGWLSDLSDDTTDDDKVKSGISSAISGTPFIGGFVSSMGGLIDGISSFLAPLKSMAASMFTKLKNQLYPEAVEAENGMIKSIKDHFAAVAAPFKLNAATLAVLEKKAIAQIKKLMHDGPPELDPVPELGADFKGPLTSINVADAYGAEIEKYLIEGDSKGNGISPLAGSVPSDQIADVAAKIRKAFAGSSAGADKIALLKTPPAAGQGLLGMCAAAQNGQIVDFGIDPAASAEVVAALTPPAAKPEEKDKDAKEKADRLAVNKDIKPTPGHEPAAPPQTAPPAAGKPVKKVVKLG